MAGVQTMDRIRLYNIAPQHLFFDKSPRLKKASSSLPVSEDDFPTLDKE